jgi:ABC-2 type transport system ATP-binding protein
MSDVAAAVRLERVTKKYGDFVAVGDLSLTIPAGVIYGVLGPNGAGKTTTLRMINDIFAPDSGTIRLFESMAPGRAAAPRIGYLPEERGLYPKMFVGEVLQFFGELRGLPRKEAIARADRWLERLGLGEWRKNRVQDLSKGMQQKVQFAAALLHDPDLLILDEPWSGLDPINAEVLHEVVAEQRRAGRTIIFSTHQMEQAEKMCDQVCIIARGKKVLEGALDRIKRDAAGDRLVAVAFNDDTFGLPGVAGDAVLEDRGLVAALRERRGYLEVELAAGQDSGHLLSRLMAAGCRLRRFEVVEPTLHQIFVDRVGAEAATDKASREEPPARR